MVPLKKTGNVHLIPAPYANDHDIMQTQGDLKITKTSEHIFLVDNKVYVYHIVLDQTLVKT